MYCLRSEEAVAAARQSMRRTITGSLTLQRHEGAHLTSHRRRRREPGAAGLSRCSGESALPAFGSPRRTFDCRAVRDRAPTPFRHVSPGCLERGDPGNAPVGPTGGHVIGKRVCGAHLGPQANENLDSRARSAPRKDVRAQLLTQVERPPIVEVAKHADRTADGEQDAKPRRPRNDPSQNECAPDDQAELDEADVPHGKLDLRPPVHMIPIGGRTRWLER